MLNHQPWAHYSITHHQLTIDRTIWNGRWCVLSLRNLQCLDTPRDRCRKREPHQRRKDEQSAEVDQVVVAEHIVDVESPADILERKIDEIEGRTKTKSGGGGERLLADADPAVVYVRENSCGSRINLLKSLRGVVAVQSKETILSP